MSAAALWVGPGAPEELSSIVAIERAAYSHPWSEQSLRAALAGEAGVRSAVLRSRREPLAYCLSQLAADEVQILNLAVHPGHRRQGIAGLLLRTVLDGARRAGARRAWLEVRASNAAARALYARAGFAERGVRRDYYASPREDALLLALELPGANS
jgi:[ribosomal protein S18]-alanine N-acetyltransferase